MSKFTSYDVANLKTVGTVKISPDGKSVAYTLSVQRNPFEEEDGSAWSELHVVNDQGESKPFVSGQVNVADVGWTPDGRHISFTEKRDGDENRDLYTIPIDGGEAQKVLSHEMSIKSYSWSPDGNRVAFIAKPEKPEDEKKLEEKGFNQEIYEEDWRHDLVWIADLQNESIEPSALELDGSASEMHWSPDGKYLALALAPTPLVDHHYMFRRLVIVDVETGKVETRVENPGKMGAVKWSPDSKAIAMVSGIDINDPREGRLMVALIQDGTLKNILPDYKGHVSDLAWKNASTLFFIGDEGVETTFNQIKEDGSDRKVLLKKAGKILNGFSASRNGKQMAFDVETPSHPDEVYYYDGKEMTRLTHHNTWLKDKEFGEQGMVTWTARDGLELQGILIKPVGYDKGDRYPLIFSVHGGPESHDQNGWLTSYSDPGQVGASQGFAVFYPNYRGSTGRGVVFSKLSQGDPAGKEFDDLADAVDHFVEIGLADPDKVGITGGSYGGYASAWGATYYSDKFAASVMFVGISDKISKTGTSDIPKELYLVHDPHWPWDDWQHYLDASPIYHLDKANTPILIMHGKEDPRVHPGQSMELYRFLKVREQTPVRLVFYPGEGHGNRRAASRLDYSLRLMRWMSHYLEGEGGDPPGYEITYEEDALKRLQHSGD